jgi:Ca2+-binding RTX toxin-like protein
VRRETPGGPNVGGKSIILAAAIGLLLVVALRSGALVYGDASHDGWPDTVVYKSHPDDEDGVIRGTNKSDELLGGHGDDAIWGDAAADVIWGDFKPCCQPTTQHDQLHGGLGNDFIYASHGRNDITGGAGNDTIHAHYGRSGTIDCGPGNDLLFLSHRSKPHYRVRNCERSTFKHEGN